MKTRIFKRKLSITEQARIARRLSAFLGAGISLVESVRLMRRPFFRPVMADISKGRRCSDAFAATEIFDRSLIEMICIGEHSGTLAGALSRAAASLESRDAISRKVTGAMIYPACIACATLGIAVFLIVYIFPKIIPLVTGMGIALPLLTKIILAASDALTGHWPIIVVVTVLSIIAARVSWKFSAFFRQCIRRLRFAAPILGPMFRNRTLADIFRSLGLLVEHGELLPAALVSVSKSQGDESYARALAVTAALITDGENFAASLAVSPTLFPSLVVDFIEMGERTGGVAGACTHIAAIYEAEVEESVKRVTQVIEPVLMLGMGLVVGSIALSIVMPIYAITANLTK